MSDLGNLFAPCAVAGLSLQNRFAMAPMTRFYAPNGVPGPVNAAYYRRRVEGGLSLIITEGTFIHAPSASHNRKIPRFYGEDALAGWQLVVDAVKGAGGRILPQLWHVGAQRKPGEGFHPEAATLSPSGLLGASASSGESLTIANIDAIIEAYALAAKAAEAMGCDGIELHAAHGYLIDQFFWSVTNVRRDRFGGDVAGRTQFGCEIVRAIRALVRPSFVVGLRFSQWKLPDYNATLASSPVELEQLLAPLTDAGVDLFHCSTRRFWDPAFAGYDRTLAGWTRRISGKPVITVGSVGLSQEFVPGAREVSEPVGIERLADLFDRGEFDLAAIGRAVIANPDWVNRMRDGEIDALHQFSPSAVRSYLNDVVDHDLF